MGEARRRKDAGDYPRTERFTPGPITVRDRRGAERVVWLDSSGHLHRLTVGRRIRDSELEALARDAARKREGGIIQPAGNELVRGPGR